MTDQLNELTKPQRTWTTYAAIAWAIAFAAPHFYWGVGGTIWLTNALSRNFVQNSTWRFLVLNWGIGMFLLAGAAVGLATIRPWGRRFPRWSILALEMFGCTILWLRVLVGYFMLGLALTGIRPFRESFREEGMHLARWFVFLWLPWFLLGALTWTAATIDYARRSKNPTATP
ncbi:MAG: DUF3995 domain-containing protein [Acidobacteria bacterium]|nr:DUF3995 domain-containing protein [Acidobacteriota bacterium]